MRYIINFETWTIQLTIAINFISSKVAEEQRIMHSRSNNVKLTSYNDADEVVDELFLVTSFKIPRKFRNINERK